MSLYLLLLLSGPFIIRVPDFHKELHQSLYGKDFHEDGFLIHKNEPLKIFFHHRDPKSKTVVLSFVQGTGYHDILCCQGKLYFKKHLPVSSLLA